MFCGRTDATTETPVLWPPHAKSWLTGKDSDAGRDWGQKKKGTTEDEMGGWHHWLDGRESEWTLGVGDGQGGLACWDSWGHKESDTTERLNWIELKFKSSQLTHNASGLPKRKSSCVSSSWWSESCSVVCLFVTPWTTQGSQITSNFFTCYSLLSKRRPNLVIVFTGFIAS